MTRAHRQFEHRQFELTFVENVCRAESWRHGAELEASPDGNFAYPTPILWEPGVLKVAYSVWGIGLRIATVTVPKEEESAPLPPVAS